MLEEAIIHARHKGVLIFASASNNGGQKQRTWPAKYEGVFCIHSTDADGNKSGFNPTERTEHDFSTIGEAIVSSWPAKASGGFKIDEIPVTIKSGTSFSTPIAACIAAFLLRFGRLHLGPDYRKCLHYPHVMRSTLKHLARNLRRDEFFYLTLGSGAGHLFDAEKETAEIKKELEDLIRNA